MSAPAGEDDTRGTQGDLPSRPTADHPVGAKGPLVTGPLVPLVGGRLQLRAIAIRVAAHFGADEKGRLQCPLPAHTGTAYLDTPEDDPAQDLRLLCNCTGRWRGFGEVRAAQAYGYDNCRRTNIEIATWVRLLAFECGAFQPVEVALPRLSADTPDWLDRVREGFALLVGLRWADGERRPVAFAVRFCAAWCGVTHYQAALAITELQRQGVIVHVDQRGLVRLYMPGADPSGWE